MITNARLGNVDANLNSLTLNTPLAAASGGMTSFVTREVPTGNINGGNVIYTLAHTPIANTECVFLSGQLQNEGASYDYTISGATITFNAVATPQSGDILLVNYQY